MRYAQRMAMIEGRRWGVLFDVKANRYALYHKDPYETVKTVTLTNNVQLREANKPYMEYLPRGTGTHGMTIALSKGNFWQNLTTGVSGGRVEIKEMRRSADGSKPPDGS